MILILVLSLFYIAILVSLTLVDFIYLTLGFYPYFILPFHEHLLW